MSEFPAVGRLPSRKTTHFTCVFFTLRNLRFALGRPHLQTALEELGLLLADVERRVGQSLRVGNIHLVAGVSRLLTSFLAPIAFTAVALFSSALREARFRDTAVCDRLEHDSFDDVQ